MNLRERAEVEAKKAGFQLELPPEARRQLTDARPSDGRDFGIADLRHLPWSSIDNASSRDLDQVEWAEKLSDKEIRVLVGIADVDAFVPKGSPLDQFADANTTSVYAGVEVFPMLPGELSTNLTSLLPDEDRLALVIDFRVAASGEVCCAAIERAIVRNRCKLAYEPAGEWLERGKDLAQAASRPWLHDQLRIQSQAASWLRELRKREGALRVESVEAIPTLRDGEVADLRLVKKNRARDLIESFMVAANAEMARFLQKNGRSSLQRLVRTPERWPRIRELARQLGTTLPEAPDARALADFMAARRREDPERFADLSLSVVKLLGKGEYTVISPGEPHEAHFGLAVHDYTHATAPNRRYPDLVTQRLLKAALADLPPPFSDAELEAIARHCMERESAARKVERLMKKVIAAQWLSNRIGQIFEGIVTGVAPKGTFVRIFAPPAEGKVTRGEAGLDVGDKCKFRLIEADPESGHIDFERMPRD